MTSGLFIAYVPSKPLTLHTPYYLNQISIFCSHLLIEDLCIQNKP